MGGRGEIEREWRGGERKGEEEKDLRDGLVGSIYSSTRLAS